MPLLLDVGPLIARFPRRDADHPRVRDYLRDAQAQPLTTWPTVAEV